MLIPSIDLLDGKVVVLKQGKEKVLEAKEGAVEIAERLSCFPEVQVVDLNAALGKGNNSLIVKKLCTLANARVGGGIRNTKKALQLIAAGAKKIIIGTKANPRFLKKLCNEIGKEKIIVAIDTFENKIVIEGWKTRTNQSIKQKIIETEPFCSEFLFSFAEKDGTMGGIDLKRIKELKSLTNNKITIAGGISSIEEVEALEKIGVNAVVGLALYNGKIGGLE